MPAWPVICGWLCIGTATATVLTVLLNRHIHSRSETWPQTQKWNMVIMYATIVVCWPGFYVLLLLWMHPRSRKMIIRFVMSD